MEKNWERPARVAIDRSELAALIEPVFPGRSVVEVETMTTGLANTNVRFRLDGDTVSHLLRLNTRDPRVARRETAIARDVTRRLGGSVPVPRLLYVDPLPVRGTHPYSIWEFRSGVLLQQLFDELPPSELVRISETCGRVLAGLGAYQFERSGELDESLTVVTPYGAPSRFVPREVSQALSGLAGQRLGAETSERVLRQVERWSRELRVIDEHNTLVHADYKRSNILLEQRGEAWRVSAVLDWEFACAGPPLIDVALFLRAGEALPPGFREAFANGYSEAGGTLPAAWLPLSRLVDLLSQMQFLSDVRDRPHVVAETKLVVQETVRLLETFARDSG